MFMQLPKRKWEDEYLRMRRWFWRLQPISGGVPNPFSLNTGYQDDIFDAFFKTCYHLKDWLKNAGVPDVEDYIKKSEYLSLCDAICNYNKHAGLDVNAKKPMRDPDTSTNTLLLLNKDAGWFNLFIINHPTKTYTNAISVAARCINEWNIFLTNKNLAIPELLEEQSHLAFTGLKLEDYFDD